MTAAPPAFSAPLTPEHAHQLAALLTGLSADEALWISGYLAGFAHRPSQSAEATAPAQARPLTILYGSETGHAAALARQLGKLAEHRGLAVRVIDMGSFRLPELREVRHLALVTSTHGDGDPPDPAMGFHEFLHGRKAPRLEGTSFAVLGLGDSTYEHFCRTARDMDQRLEALGARRLHARADCDVDYEDQAEAWSEAVVAAFAEEMKAAAPLPASPLPASDAQATEHRHAPFAATILESLVLNGRGSDKETRHLEFSLEGSGLSFEPGDSLGVVPENDPELVAELIDALGLSHDDPVKIGPAAQPLAEVLTRHSEITTLTPRFLQLYGEAAAAEPLRVLSLPENRGELMAYVACRQVADVVAEFPVTGLEATAFVAMLRRLQPRLYSLASSLSAFPGEAHITVAVLRSLHDGRLRKGAASAWLAERCRPDDTVAVTIAANPNFRLPTDSATPIIMVGAGTGIAPYRAFLQEREAIGASGHNWLFFGDRRFRTDFLYQVEWLRLLKDGILSRMDVAFSRDQGDKVYVQHRLLEHGREIYGWLQAGAHLYVCGDASRLAPDVHAALATIIAGEGCLSNERAEEYLAHMRQEKRYQRDVY